MRKVEVGCMRKVEMEVYESNGGGVYERGEGGGV